MGCMCLRGWSHVGQCSWLSSEGYWGGACRGGPGRTSGRALSRVLPLGAAMLCHSPPNCIMVEARRGIWAGRDGKRETESWREKGCVCKKE